MINLKNAKNNNNFECEDSFKDKLSIVDKEKINKKNFRSNIRKKIINNKRINDKQFNIYKYFILLFGFYC